jgi:hypothetical protein
MHTYVLHAKIWPATENDIPAIREALLDIGVEAHKICVVDPQIGAMILGVVILGDQDNPRVFHEELEVRTLEHLKRNVNIRDVNVHTSWTKVSELDDLSFGPDPVY